ncbi:hypothetical protein GVAV_001244 [Gurleya vavrai]
MRREINLTKIVCTLGPSTSDTKIINEMLNNGMSIARLNCSHGNIDERSEMLQKLHILRQDIKTPIFGIALDTKGPEIRIKIKDNIQISKNEKYTFCNKEDCNDDFDIHFNFNNIQKINKDYVFSIDDGKLIFKVIDTDENKIFGLALNDHFLKNKKSANFSNVELGIPFLSNQDIDDITFAAKNNVDFIFASFVSCQEDILEIRNIVKKYNRNLLIIAKIESIKGIKNIDQILSVADGIMIARGDLFTETGYDELFFAQKYLAEKANDLKKPFIVATQMIENMIEQKTPTRPEISDIGNAVLDGASCIMTSAETAIGKHPIDVVKSMAQICKDAENFQTYLKKKSQKDIKDYFQLSCTKKLSYNNVNLIISDSILDIQNIHQDGYLTFVFSNNDFLIQNLTIYKGILPIKINIIIGTEIKKLFLDLKSHVEQIFNITNDVKYNCYFSDKERKGILSLNKII